MPGRLKMSKEQIAAPEFARRAGFDPSCQVLQIQRAAVMPVCSANEAWTDSAIYPGFLGSANEF